MPLTFRENNIRRIIEGQKTQTRRASGYKLKVGRVYGAKSNWYRKAPVNIRVLRHRRQRLGDISLDDVKREGYQTLDDFIAIWVKLHGSWKPDKIVDVYDFKVVKPNGKRQVTLNGTRESVAAKK